MTGAEVVAILAVVAIAIVVIAILASPRASFWDGFILAELLDAIFP